VKPRVQIEAPPRARLLAEVVEWAAYLFVVAGLIWLLML
jgi:hypothetical protein